ncbi:hypothetical protein DERP_012980 [Dermatophagoides pteronyssinus]|uniref:Uncharacterized protein n=1 Tax=Dermatophagoides pteronyssinus TaxID=6956 RepID=A0ABQ8ISI4_DERPT|nr:hypothetical protein DERP_012980 [Dermatophagoides pteronyssinus]
MSTELMNSPSIRRSNSYRIALRKSGVPKELLDNIDHPLSNNTDNNIESQRQTNSTTSSTASKDRLFKKRKQQGINLVNSDVSEAKISIQNSDEKENFLMTIKGDTDEDEDGSDETWTLKPLSLDTELESYIDNEHQEHIVQNGQHSKIRNDQIIENNNNDMKRNTYSKCKHLFCLFCCCNYCCCLLRDCFS